MPPKRTVKARQHYGTGSLNLTIPTEVVRKQNIRPGDVFEVSLQIKEEEVIIQYRRVYKVE